MIKLDTIDKKLLELLQANSKLNIKQVADHFHLTKTPVYERIRRLEREGLIERYVAVLDPDKLPSKMVVFCSVSLESQNLEAIRSFAEEVNGLPEVMESYLMGGANDFLLKVMVDDLKAYHEFSAGKLAALPNVAQIKSTFVLNETKRSTVIPLE
jgi:Lrp/AsnC family transcriptional regulator